MSGRDLGRFGCDGVYRLPRDFNKSDFVEFVMDGVKQVKFPQDPPLYDTSCRIPTPVAVEYVDDRTAESCRSMFPDIRTYRGTSFPPQPPNLGVASARDLLREQSELIAKYAAHCEAKASTCSTVATLLEYTERAKLARSIALIYFRSATLEV